MTEAVHEMPFPDDDVMSILANRIIEDRGISREAAYTMASDYCAIRDAVEEDMMEVSAYSPSQLRLAYPGQEKFWLDVMLFFKGLPTIIKSRNGQGKTHLLSWAFLRAAIMHSNWDILNNIPWYWEGEDSLASIAMPNFIQIHSMSTMLRQCAMSVLADRVPLVGIDEMDHAITSQSWKSEENQSWQHWTYIERHLEVRGPILIYHSWNDIPYYMRKGGVVNQHLWVSVHKGQRYVFNTNTRPYFLHVSGSFIPYSSHGAVGFKIDVDMGRMHSTLNSTKRKGIAEQVLANLESCIVDAAEEDNWEEEVRDSEEWARKEIMRLLDMGLTLKEIMKEELVSQTELYKIKRVWVRRRKQR